ncbi:MAG: 5'-3' exonuclease H3TH domain-containing protein [Candidatus Saccharimonadales bacterium]
MAKEKKKKSQSKVRLRILLIDGNNYVHRGFWAVEALSNSDGFPTNAVKGTINIILKDIETLKPDRIVVVFDKGGKKNWRSEIYPEYKRSPERLKQKDDSKYEDIKPQFKPIRQLLKSMGIRTLGKKGVEGDDLMGTLAKEFEAEGHEVLVSTNDKDMASLVTENVFIVTAKERELLDPVGIKMQYGVKPNQIIEFLMLQGDKVDNIPGVVKCGPGTAAKWLTQYGTIKNLLANIDDFKPPAPKRKGSKEKPLPVAIQNLLAAKKHFKLTRRLVTLKLDETHKVTLENCVLGEPDWDRIKRLCARYELKETHRQIVRVLKKREGTVSRWAI